MIKTIQYLAEADPSPFQNVSRPAMLFGIEKNDADLAAVFSQWCTVTTEHRMHNDAAYTKISANSGVDQG